MKVGWTSHGYKLSPTTITYSPSTTTTKRSSRQRGGECYLINGPCDLLLLHAFLASISLLRCGSRSSGLGAIHSCSRLQVDFWGHRNATSRRSDTSRDPIVPEVKFTPISNVKTSLGSCTLTVSVCWTHLWCWKQLVPRTAILSVRGATSTE